MTVTREEAEASLRAARALFALYDAIDAEYEEKGIPLKPTRHPGLAPLGLDHPNHQPVKGTHR